MRSISGDVRTGRAGDTELVFAARNGNTQARETLFRRHVNQVHGLAFRLAGRLANHREIVDEVFVHLFASLDQVTHPDAMRPWVAGQVVRVVRRTIRRRHLLARLGFTVVASPHFDPALEESPPEVAEELDRLYAAVERLPMKLRMAFLLRRVENMGLADVAMALDASLSQVRRWVARAESRMGVLPEGAVIAKASA
jgi:RNA polymerase sigma-70 factor (ECF subfamily)